MGGVRPQVVALRKGWMLLEGSAEADGGLAEAPPHSRFHAGVGGQRSTMRMPVSSFSRNSNRSTSFSLGNPGGGAM